MPDHIEQRILDDISIFGWHVVCIKADEHGPSFDYTVGLMHTLCHPEVIIFGLDVKVMHRILSVVVDNIRAGGGYRNSGTYENVLEGRPCFILPVRPSRHPEFLGYAMWHWRHIGKPGSLQAVQLFWPDRNGKFPWDKECEPAVAALQPRLQEGAHT